MQKPEATQKPKRERHLIDVGSLLPELQDAAQKVELTATSLAKILLRGGLDRLKANGYRIGA